jgi:hypothetical protein
VAFRACLRYIHFLRRLDHVYHLKTSVRDPPLADYASIQLLSVSLQRVACSASVLFIFAISFCFARAYEEFGSPCSSLSCDDSVLCCWACNAS